MWRWIRENKVLARGVNVICGKIVFKGVAEAYGLEYNKLDDLLH